MGSYGGMEASAMRCSKRPLWKARFETHVSLDAEGEEIRMKRAMGSIKNISDSDAEGDVVDKVAFVAVRGVSLSR